MQTDREKFKTQLYKLISEVCSAGVLTRNDLYQLVGHLNKRIKGLEIKRKITKSF